MTFFFCYIRLYIEREVYTIYSRIKFISYNIIVEKVIRLINTNCTLYTYIKYTNYIPTFTYIFIYIQYSV